MNNKKYTESQVKAINWAEGPVIVLAGPGSGKTAVLTERIIRILEESRDESFRLLALTFTNKAATEMAERISSRIEDAMGRLFIGTFHSFCAEVLRNHGTYVGIKSDFEIYSSQDDLNEILEGLKLQYKDEFPSDDIDELKLLNAIQYFERNLCFTSEDVDKNMPNTPYKNALKWFYLHYLEELKRLNVLDFDALILFAYKLFISKPNIVRIYRSTYRYINIDEFQDTNYGQYMLIKSMSGAKNNNLFLVADDDQVIYGWNGASHKRISEFKDEYKAELIQLNQNFRCPPEVIKLANKLIRNNSGRTDDKKPLESMKQMSDNDAHLYYQKFNSHNDEINAVVKLIQKLKQDFPKETICVLARNNRLLETAYNAAVEKGIQCEKSKRKNDFETIHVLWMYLMLKLANRRTDRKLFDQIIAIMDNGKGLINSEKLVLEAELDNGDLLRALSNNLNEIVKDENFVKSIRRNLVEGKNFIQFIEDAFEWCEKRIKAIEIEEYRDQALQEFVLERTVWKDFQRKLGYSYELDDIPLATYMQEFAMVSKEADPKENSVQFLTIHASKGKEFDHVILIGMVNDELPSFQSIKKGLYSPEMEEERRNCFVAITRAKRRLYLTYSENYFGWKKDVSIFMREMFAK